MLKISIEGDRTKVPGHKLDDRPESDHRGPDATPAKPASADRRIDDALRAKLVEHTLADLVRTLVVPDLFAHEKTVRIARHLLGHGFSQSFGIEVLVIFGFFGLRDAKGPAYVVGSRTSNAVRGSYRRTGRVRDLGFHSAVDAHEPGSADASIQ